MKGQLQPQGRNFDVFTGGWRGGTASEFDKKKKKKTKKKHLNCLDRNPSV